MILDILRSTFTSIWANKVRSFLTMLGVILGVSSVVTLISVGEGVKQDVKNLVQGLGTNMLFVIPGNLDPATINSGGSSNPASFISGDVLSMKDIESLREISELEAVAPFSMLPGNVRNGEKLTPAEVIGTYPEIEKVFTGIKIEQGRNFTDDELSSNLAILGNDTKTLLFGEEEAIGKKITIGKGEEFEVIGIMSKPKETSALGGNELGQMILVPFDTTTRIIGKEQVYRIGLKVANQYDAKEVAKLVKQNMQNRHQADEFSVFTQEDMLDLLGQFLNIATAMVSAIAAIALIVGGIGIMNIMLVTVTERTREIGIRKAVGATSTAIMWQFLVEAVIISVMGGLFGLVFSFFASIMVNKYSPINPVITLDAILLALSVSSLVGIVFGLAPALRAAKKDPIEALRYE